MISLADIISKYREIYHNNKRGLRTILAWFIASMVLGGLVFFAVPDLLDQILSVFEDKFGEIPALNFDLAMEIFLNNLQASAIGLFGGLLVGLGPFLVVAVNGFILGYVIVSVTALSPDNPFVSLGILLAGLVPHGIIEIPAFLIAAAIGLRLGVDWLRSENYGHRLHTLWIGIKETAWVIPMIVVMLFVAAIIEVYVSGNIIDKLIN